MWTLAIPLALSGRPAELVGSASLFRGTVSATDPAFLDLSLRNPGKRPVTIESFADPACFVQHLVSIQLSPRAPQLPKSEDCVAQRVQIKPAGALAIRVDLRDLYTLGSDHEIAVTWRPRPDHTVTSWSQGGGPLRVRAPIATGRAQVGGPALALPAGRFELLGHGHKSVMSGGPPSPLIVHYRWTVPGAEPVESSVNLQRDESPQFPVGPYLFDYVAHEYDQWMDLRVYP